jgi:hypothetical protein
MFRRFTRYLARYQGRPARLWSVAPVVAAVGGLLGRFN